MIEIIMSIYLLLSFMAALSTFAMDSWPPRRFAFAIACLLGILPIGYMNNISAPAQRVIDTGCTMQGPAQVRCGVNIQVYKITNGDRIRYRAVWSKDGDIRLIDFPRSVDVSRIFNSALTTPSITESADTAIPKRKSAYAI